MIAAAACTLLAGFLIGATTLGGLIVVPALAEFAHMDIDRAVASSSAAMAAPSLLAAAIAWRDTEQRRTVLTVMAGSAAGAAAGAAMLAVVPASITIGLIAVLATVGGLRGLATDRWHARDGRPASRNAVVALSIVAGNLSAITGTGGPVSIWPLLSLAAQPVALCWLAAQAIQLPVAVAATAVNALAGRVDVTTTIVLSILLAAGFIVGRRVTKQASVAWLGRMASLMLLAIALWLAFVLMR